MGIGVNCFGLRKPFYDGFDAALDRLKEIGVTSLEVTIAFPSDAERKMTFKSEGNYADAVMESAIWLYEQAPEKIQYLRDKGFVVQCVHVMSFLKGPESLLKLVPMIIELAKKSDIHYFVFSPMKGTDELMSYAPVLNQACEALAEVGAKLILHNHEQEGELIGDRTGLEVLLEKCPLLGVELDVGWAKYAGCDAVDLMEKIKDQLVLVHLKDIKADASPENRSTCFTAIGEGSIPLAAIMKKAAELGKKDDDIIIDQDDAPVSMLDDLERGIVNIKKAMA